MRTRVGLHWVWIAALLVGAPVGAAQAQNHGGNPWGAWQPLITGTDAPGWRGWSSAGLPSGWHVDGGVLSKRGEVEDLVSQVEYGDFDLEFEWKLDKGGNGGVFYRATHQYDHIYWSGPEYQLLDDANAEDGKLRLTAAASDYALYAAPAGIVHKYDHWNRSRIVMRGQHVEHWLNGRKVVEYELGSDDWKQRVAASKFKAWPAYGLAATGLLGLQGDHEGAMAFRRMRIRTPTGR